MNEEQREAEACLKVSRERLNSIQSLLKQSRLERMAHIEVMQNTRLGLQEARGTQRLARQKLRELSS